MIIHGTDLKAIALLAPKKDIREYLLGVHIEVKGSQAILVATDGSALGVLRLTLAEEFETHEFTIPLSLLTMITAKDEVTVAYTKDEQGPGMVTLTQSGKVLAGKAVEGTYPQYRRVIPEKVSGVQDHLIAVRYLETAAKVCSMVNGVPMVAVDIQHNGGDACIVNTGNKDFVLIVMPLREKYAPVVRGYTKPDWL